jgi:hypothetical protein
VFLHEYNYQKVNMKIAISFVIIRGQLYKLA